MVIIHHFTLEGTSLNYVKAYSYIHKAITLLCGELLFIILQSQMFTPFWCQIYTAGVYLKKLLDIENHSSSIINKRMHQLISEI